jgi:hypothetical protein
MFEVSSYDPLDGVASHREPRKHNVAPRLLLTGAIDYSLQLQVVAQVWEDFTTEAEKRAPVVTDGMRANCLRGDDATCDKIEAVRHYTSL